METPPTTEAREHWQHQLGDELRFWNDYISAGGLQWPEEFARRQDPAGPLKEPEIADRIAGRTRVRILDVGAGPMTFLGKRLPGVELDITPIDPLADSYNALLREHGIAPPVPTQPCEGENIRERFRPNTFDFAYARNALDHSHDPRSVIEQMIGVVKPGGWVILRHRPNEAESAGYAGLHQWNFDYRDGHFCISSRDTTHDLTALLEKIVEAECHRDRQWLVCAMRKRGAWERLRRRLTGISRGKGTDHGRGATWEPDRSDRL